MAIAGFALRDIIFVLVGLAGVYCVVMLLRLLQVRRRKAAMAYDETLASPLAGAATVERMAEDAPAIPQQAEALPRFGAELARSHQERELRQLREEVVQLREEVGLLRAELVDLNAARHVSPQYADAMALAQRGLTAQDVADRCGISLGEAELVWALSRGPMNFEQEEDYGGESGLEHARSA